MKGSSALRRLSVPVLFALLCALCAPAGWTRSPRGLADGELRDQEAKMAAGALLHQLSVPPPPPGTAVFCRECHPALPPHAGDSIAVVMANEHAQRMDCLFCHWSDMAGTRPKALWQPWSSPDQPGGKRLLLAVYPPSAANREELARLRGRVTSQRKCFDRGPSCGDCHRPGGITPWARPGEAAGQAAALEKLGNYFLLAPGAKWYLPEAR